MVTMTFLSAFVCCGVQQPCLLNASTELGISSLKRSWRGAISILYPGMSLLWKLQNPVKDRTSGFESGMGTNFSDCVEHIVAAQLEFESNF